MDQSPGLNGYGNWKIVTVQPCIFPPAQNVPEGSLGCHPYVRIYGKALLQASL